MFNVYFVKFSFFLRKIKLKNENPSDLWHEEEVEEEEDDDDDDPKEANLH